MGVVVDAIRLIAAAAFTVVMGLFLLVAAASLVFIFAGLLWSLALTIIGS